MLKFAYPKLIIKNISKKSLTILNTITLVPNQEVDVFTYVPDISESTVIDALRQPKGQLYIEHVQRKNIQIKECSLVTFDALTVTDSKLDSVNKGTPGQVLSINKEGKFEWVYRSESSIMNLDPPLTRQGERVSLSKADEFTNGYLSKEDFKLFKGSSKGFRIWQYQDVSVAQNPVRLNIFQNGKGVPFDKNYIVNHSAVIVNKKDLESPPHSDELGWKRYVGMKDTVKVHQHIGDTVMLTKEPDPSLDCRIYYMVILPEGAEIPENYEQPPRYVRNERIEFMDLIDIDTGGNKQIRGPKSFRNTIIAHESIGIRKENPAFPLDVGGKARFDTIRISENASANYSLLANSVGDAEWSASPIVSYIPPNNHYAGQVWVKIPEYELFVFDGARKKWLSTHSNTVDGSFDNIITNDYLKSSGNLSNSVNSLVLPHDTTLVGLTVSSQYKQSWVAEVHVNHKLVEGGLVPVINSDRQYNMQLNVDLRAGDKIQLYVNGENISMPYIQAILRKRI